MRDRSDYLRCISRQPQRVHVDLDVKALAEPARQSPRAWIALALLVCIVLVVSALGYSAVLPGHSHTPTWKTARLTISRDFADPTILLVNGVYYAYATNAYGMHIQVTHSTDLVHWTPLLDALPTLPSWASASGGMVWAPGVIETSAGFVMYYTAREASSGRQCIGIATSGSADGPFHDGSTRPFICQRGLGGTIDASPFRSGSSLYLYFKSDGNCCGITTYIWGQRLSADGLHLTGQPVALLMNNEPWEGAVVEGPSMFEHNGHDYLFFSGNDYGTTRYAVGYAECQSPLGPCEQSPTNPILASSGAGMSALAGPGGEDVFTSSSGQTLMAFHSWNITSSGGLGDSRYMLIAPIEWHNGQPSVVGIRASR